MKKKKQQKKLAGVIVFITMTYKMWWKHIPADIQGQAEPGPEHLDLAVGIFVHCRGVGLGGL